MTSPPREKQEENAKRKQKHENNPCTIPTKYIETKLKLIQHQSQQRRRPLRHLGMSRGTGGALVERTLCFEIKYEFNESREL